MEKTKARANINLRPNQLVRRDLFFKRSSDLFLKNSIFNDFIECPISKENNKFIEICNTNVDKRRIKLTA